jgi:hypothetical protein
MKVFFFIFAFMSLACLASAGTYYADISVDISPSGSAEVSGTSNHAMLSPGTRDSLTSKKGALWLFNLTLPGEDIFSDYVYSVSLPAGASVNYVKAESFRITTSGDRIVVSGSASNKSLGVIIQYQMDNSGGSDGGLYVYAGLAFFMALLLSLVYYILTRKTDKSQAVNKPGIEHPPGESKPSGPVSSNYSKYASVLTERQKDIIRVLEKEGEPVNQALLCERLDLPKSSVSRNVANLADLGIVEKKRVGMSTFLSLKQE